MNLAEALIEEGQQDGWQKGQQDGWQKGQQEGWQKGRQEGWQKGQQEGHQKGLERGTLIGRIQLSQGLLDREAATTEELAKWETGRLRAELSALETQLRDRLQRAAAAANAGD